MHDYDVHEAHYQNYEFMSPGFGFRPQGVANIIWIIFHLFYYTFTVVGNKLNAF